MRRVKDDWVNATQILKCCNFPKAKRTKILEKGVQQGLHEKIQGGYGRFQGTWIPLPDALRLAATYALAPELAPVLYLDFTKVQVPRKVKPAPGSALNEDGTPVKRKYVKKAKKDESSKKMKPDSPTRAYNQDSFNSLSRGPSHLSSFNSQQSQPSFGAPLPQSFQQPEFGNIQQPTYNGQIDFQNYQMQYQRLQQQQQQQVPYMPNGGVFSIPNVQQQQPHMMGHFRHEHKVNPSQSTNDTQWSHDDHKESDTSMSSHDNSGIHGQNKNNSEEDFTYASQLLKFFSEDNAPIPYFIHNPPYDFNINEAIDDEGHTPLHWAASIGNYMMIHVLTTKGANPLVVNNFGLNPLSKSISFNNCYELKNFDKVLDDLELCLINTDINGRTPLHYLCQFAKVKSKYECLKYYIDIILNKLSSLSEQNNSSINLLKNVLDHQDVNGDTCLHLAARSRSSKLVKHLLSYGTRDDLVNVNNETAKMLILNYNLLPYEYEGLQPAQPIDGRKNEIMSTPIQNKKGNIVETPDTQRTTVQDDDMDDDEHRDRVRKEQVDSLMRNDKNELSGNMSMDDNKENIFIDDSFKAYETSMTISTPKYQHGSHQPLAVISERTVESTPKGPEEKKFLGPSLTQDYKPHPPKLDDEGRIIEYEKEDEDFDVRPKLLIADLSSMVGGMINSLGDSYTSELEVLKKEFHRLKKALNEKKETNATALNKIKAILGGYSLEEFEDLEEGKEILQKEINVAEKELLSKEQLLLGEFELNHSCNFKTLVQENESSDEGEENKARQAIELSQLQIQRRDLLLQILQKVKDYGVDSKMYKYRKLISLSCGLKVEDIDGLIDGIEESLMETS